ncbi:MAG: ABC transporter ATP-binding protein [Lentisphaeria bacterium]|nr:ABC transporter ATP-binding protein [Lentisphaeria bacterium]
MLTVKNLSVRYGAIQALSNISFEINQGEIVTLLGANGAGKTTTLSAISKTVKWAGGDILFEGNSLKKLSPHKIVSHGLAHCPEGRRIFPELTVMENLDLGAYTLADQSQYSTLLDKVFHYFPRLQERKEQKGGTLSGGEQQMLAVGRALMSHPKLLMLDEPSLGLAPLIVEKIFEIIKQVNKEEGMTVFLVEQNAYEALQVADRAYVVETGEIKMDGQAKDLLHDDRIKELYLGG